MSSSDSDSDSDTKGPCNWQEIPGLTTQSEVFGPCCWKSAPTDPSQMPHSLIEYELKYYYEPSPLPKDVCYDLDCPETDPHLDRYNSLEYAFNHLCWDLRNKLNNEIYLLKAKHDALNRDYAALLGQVIGSSAVKISSEPWERLHCDADRSFENWEECVCCNCFRKLEHSFWEKIWETRSLMVDLDFLRIEHLELIEKYAWLKYNVALSYNIPESEGWSPHGNLEFPSSVFTDSYE
ncbi:hypothetical protein OCU04_001630 [Sclerotinia nivalis]|nr:hypothetical protein OCU04_001630 [Sclerotinia nivalis]